MTLYALNPHFDDASHRSHPTKPAIPGILRTDLLQISTITQGPGFTTRPFGFAAILAVGREGIQIDIQDGF